jgi:hypothetical protein
VRADDDEIGAPTTTDLQDLGRGTAGHESRPGAGARRPGVFQELGESAPGVPPGRVDERQIPGRDLPAYTRLSST